MCAGAMVQARIGRLVYAVGDPRAGAAGSVFNVVQSAVLNHQVQVTRGVLASEAQAQLAEFFAELRQRQRNQEKGLAGSSVSSNQPPVGGRSSGTLEARRRPSARSAVGAAYPGRARTGRGVRVVEGARLENEWAPKASRGFESHPLRPLTRAGRRPGRPPTTE